MKDQFATYEIALAVKELGFNEPCLATYRGGSLYQFGSGGYYEDWNEHRSYGDMNQWVSAPLWQQVIDWFEDRYQMSINLHKVGEHYLFNISVPYHSEVEGFGVEYLYNDSYHRTMDAILKAIELIKQK